MVSAAHPRFAAESISKKSEHTIHKEDARRNAKHNLGGKKELRCGPEELEVEPRTRL